jgi:methylmalonyl-CoA mutase, C-terminal domain
MTPEGSGIREARHDSNGKVTAVEIPPCFAVDDPGYLRAAVAPTGVRHPVPARLRIVVAKPGLDGHDRGAKIVARALRDAGHEVIYTGLHQTPEQIVETAIQEDADLIGLSVLSGAHMTLFKRLIELLGERDAADIRVFGGGIIPHEDIPVLEELGVAKVFTPGATTGEITGWVAGAFAEPA